MNKKTVLNLSAILASTVLLSGCASIVSKSDYPVCIYSTPSGASVTIVDKAGVPVLKTKTPTTVTLSASRGFFQPEKYTLIYEKPGYQKQTTILSAGLDGWYIGNAVFGGGIGFLIVDPLTGAMWRLSDSATTTLNKQVSSNETELKVMNLSDIPAEWKDKLVSID